MKSLINPKILVFIGLLAMVACEEDEKPNLRPSIDYAVLTAETPYSQLFVDANGATTVDLFEGNTQHRMFQALNYYSTSSISNNAHIDASTLNNMFSNTGDPFVDVEVVNSSGVTTIDIDGEELNATDFDLRSHVAASKSDTEAAAVRAEIESLFEQIEEASHFVTSEASQGQAGKLGNYLVDEKGIEIAQVIQKSLIGALQLDYIGNVLLAEGLTADNHTLVGDNNYTALEHNWDVAYGLLTLNPIYLQGSTNETRTTVEFGAGSYLWEYNKANYAKIFPAFLKGRAAIVNNDKAELETQATFIRTEFEKAIANAALGYLDKWKTGTTDAARAHAIAEGIGFIYSLRFATKHGADATFSDAVLDDLLGGEHGFWSLDADKISAASEAISTKFGL